MPDQIWSPWRSVYIKRDRDAEAPSSNSVFAQREAEGDDEKNLIVWRGAHVFVIMNLYPYNNGHLLIVPYREVARYEDLTREEQHAIAETTERCIGWLRSALQPEGFNVGMNLGAAAGAGIPEHVHVHVVPRWRGDTNFMPTTAEVKVIPQALQTTYEKVRAAAAADDGHAQ